MNETRNKPRFWLRALRWAGLAILCGVTVELAARVDDRLTFGAPLLGSYELEDLFQPTPRGYRGVPGASYVKWALNGSGFRGPEIRPYTGQTRVLAYGASETFGIYEDPGNEFPRVLERDLNSGPRGNRFEVINAGMPGMRVGSGITFLYDIGQSLRPNVVVIYPTPTHYVGVSRPYCGRPVTMPGPSGFTLPPLRMAEKIKERLKEVLPRWGMTLMRQAAIASAARKARVIDQVQPQSLEALRTDLVCAVKAAREIGATPILVTHANRFASPPAPDEDFYLTGWRLQYPELRKEGFLSLERQANETIRSVAETLHVQLVDAAAALGGNRENFADHAHFTNLGASRMGALLSTAVLKSLETAPSTQQSNSAAGAQFGASAVSGVAARNR